MFTTTAGTPLDGPTVTKALQRAMAEAGLPRQTFHAFRHAAGSIALAAGASLRTVQDMLGHSSITTTMNVYTHVYDDEQAANAVRMDAALRQFGEF